MRNLVALLTGAMFGAGLLVSGMTDTRKIQGWLDVFGDWDPTLAFVLGGAIIPMAIAWYIAERRKTALLGAPIPVRSDAAITPRLATGSVLFGIGWGLSGLCPGPAMASLGFGGVSGLMFFGAMALGMFALPKLESVWTPGTQTGS